MSAIAAGRGSARRRSGVESVFHAGEGIGSVHRIEGMGLVVNAAEEDVSASPVAVHALRLFRLAPLASSVPVEEGESPEHPDVEKHHRQGHPDHRPLRRAHFVRDQFYREARTSE